LDDNDIRTPTHDGDYRLKRIDGKEPQPTQHRLAHGGEVLDDADHGTEYDGGRHMEAQHRHRRRRTRMAEMAASKG
jgi:hypothetical protein